MSIGYACLAIAVPGSELKSCMLKNADPKRLLALIHHNLNSLEILIDYNIRNGIRLFRISSDLIPFGSGVAAQLPWREIFSDKLYAICKKITDSGMRVSMHPGQYTVLNSPVLSVAKRAVEDLSYHAGALDSLGLSSEHKIILHVGGAYGDKKQAKSRFVSRYSELEPAIRKRLVLENDDTTFTVEDALEISAAAGMPVVYDNLHNLCNPSDASKPDSDWIRLCGATWEKGDGIQKVHYAQQHPNKRPGAHSDSIRIDPFLDFFGQLPNADVDIMLEVKDKNLSALKCIHCTSKRGMGAIEAEWGRYKYSVLEHSPEYYQAIRRLLRDKSEYPALDMYRMIETALDLPAAIGGGVNAAQHVWGYFKNKASAAERQRFQTLLEKYSQREIGIQPLKKHLLHLAVHYREDYLLNGYYFYNL